MSSENVFRIPLFISYSYEELKSQQLALGLDLQQSTQPPFQVQSQCQLLRKCIPYSFVQKLFIRGAEVATAGIGTGPERGAECFVAGRCKKSFGKSFQK